MYPTPAAEPRVPRSLPMTTTRRPDPTTHAPVLAAAMAVFFARWYTSRGRVVFHITPDEPGQLAIARFVSGRPRWDMFDHSTWRPLYGTLLGLVQRFSDDPATGFRMGLALNAALGAVAVVLLYALARRLTGCTPWWSAVLAVVVAWAPAVLYTTAWVWSEALVSVTYLGAVLALLHFHDRPSVPRGVMVSALAIAGYAAHSRLLPLAVVVVIVVAWVVWSRRLGWAAGVAILGALGACYALASWYSEFLVARIWEDPLSRNSYGGVFDQLKLVGSMSASAIGQFWYLLVTTAGVFGVGVFVLARAAARRRSEGADDPDGPARADAVLVLLAAGSLVALSIVFMTDRWRPDQVVYGRYNDAVVGPVVLVGLGWLVRARAVAVARVMGGVALVAIGLATALWWLRADELRQGLGVRSMILGLQPLIGPVRAILVPGVTALAVVVTALAALTAVLARRGRTGAGLAAVVVIVALGVAHGRTSDNVDGALNSWNYSASMEPLRDAILADQTQVRVRFVPNSEDPAANTSQQRQRRMIYQFYLPDIAMYLDGDLPAGSEARYVFAPEDDPVLMSRGAQVVWTDPKVPMALYDDPTG